MFGLLLFGLSLGAVLYCIWRRCLHPLHKYPGPFFNSVSEIPNALAMASGRQHSYIKGLHARYGNTVRVGPNELSFSSPAAWEDIYNRQGLTMERHPILQASVRNFKGGNASIMQALCQTKDHARHRRALGYPFSNSALLKQQAIVIANVKKFILCLGEMASESRSIEMTSWFGFLTMDVIGDFTFAKTFGCLDSRGPTEWSIAMIEVFRSGTYENAIQHVFGIETWLAKATQWLLVPRGPERWRKIHFANSIQAAKQRISNGPGDHPDLIHFLLKHKFEKPGLTEREILLNTTVLVIAGSETTAGALSSLVCFLCTNPKAYVRLTKLIRQRFLSEDQINFSSFQGKTLAYLDACIQETLRCVPPQTNSPLRVVPKGGAMICGEKIHEGCSVSVGPFAMANLDRHFARPTEFRPERWLPRDDVDWDDTFANDQLEASQPFLLGPRQCLGINLAWLEMRVTMAFIILNFDFELARPDETLEKWTMDDDARHFRGFKTWLKPALPVRFTPVVHPEKAHVCQ